MKITTFKIITFLVLIPLLSFSNTPLKGKYKKTKEISKTFEANDDTILNIKNSFGNIDIVTWDTNRIEIDVTITVSGNDEEAIEKKLEDIRIQFEKSNNQVHATTHSGKSKSKSWFSSNWFRWNSSSNINFRIDYKVKMPTENDLNIYNDYGTINLNELNGKANINCDFGKLIIGSLNNTTNEIHCDYTKNSVIDFVESASIYADFSNFTIEEANDIKLNGDYTTSEFTNIKNLKYNCDFGKLTIDKVANIHGSSDYLSLHIGELSNSATISTDFGSIKIDLLKKGFKNLNIKSDYTGIKIGIDSDASCNIYSELSFGNLKYDGDLFTFNKVKEKTTEKEYQGYFNNENTNATITTETEFGSIRFYQK